MQRLYSNPERYDLPKVAKHEPFSYLALIKADKEAQNLFADFSLLRRRIDGVKGHAQLKNTVRAFNIDLESLTTQI